MSSALDAIFSWRLGAMANIDHGKNAAAVALIMELLGYRELYSSRKGK
jgi:hypothetical protein